MKPEDIKKIVKDTPCMRLGQAQEVTDLIRECKAKNVLELGFAHGVSTCYLAAALEEMGGGCVTTIDLESAKHKNPNIEQLIDMCGFRNVDVNWYYEPTSYTWRLMKFLEQVPIPKYDFCYIDGAHNWFVDGFAFFLVDRLLNVGGWIVFDDLDWTYAASPTLSDTDWVKSMPLDERETPQIRKVYELLVKTHLSYNDFRIRTGWAYAHKTRETTLSSEGIRREVVYIPQYESLTVKNILSRLQKAITRRYKQWIKGEERK